MAMAVNLLSVLLLACTLERNAGEFSSKTPHSYYWHKEFPTGTVPTREDINDAKRQCDHFNFNDFFGFGTSNQSIPNYKLAYQLVALAKKYAKNLNRTANGFDPRTLTQPNGNARMPDYIMYTDALPYIAPPSSCESKAYDVRYTNDTKDFGNNIVKTVCGEHSTLVNQTIDDKLLRFFDTCPRYLEEVKNNPAAKAEVRKFEGTPQFKNVLHSVAKTFNDSGFRFEMWLHRLLNAEDLLTIYELCALDVAQDRSKLHTSTGWCALIREHFQVLDYYMDMDHYYTSSGAYPINYQSACGVYKFLLELVKQTADTEHHSTTLSHLETFLPVVTLLNFIDPAEALTAANYATLGSSRKFRVERIAPYGSQLAFDTFRCGEELHIYFMLNARHERPRHCAAENYCTLQELEDHYTTACPKPVSEICAPARNGNVRRSSRRRSARFTTSSYGTTDTPSVTTESVFDVISNLFTGLLSFVSH